MSRAAETLVPEKDGPNEEKLRFGFGAREASLCTNRKCRDLNWQKTSRFRDRCRAGTVWPL